MKIDEKVAKEWYLKSAEQQYPRAQYALATTAADDSEVLRLLNAASEKDDPQAILLLGDYYNLRVPFCRFIFCRFEVF
mgnify:CR=1 FL=1